jgi:hypothetical protein
MRAKASRPTRARDQQRQGERHDRHRPHDGSLARRRLERLLDRHGLLLLHDARFPSATACIAGEPIRGSWWGHPKGKLIFETLTGMGDSVAWAKLVLGKETLVHRRLWPALVAIAESRQEWQVRGLGGSSQRLLRRLERGGSVRIDSALRAAAMDLERRLLARGTSEHTSSGKHVRSLETWGAWAKRVGVTKKDRPAAADALRALSEPVLAWVGRDPPPGLLPWPMR